MTVTIRPGKARGTLYAPPSKSMAHRYLIAAALAEGQSQIQGVAYSEDVLATLDCLKALGVPVACRGDTVSVTGGRLLSPKEPLRCRESGSTLRFFLPLCLLSGREVRLEGSARLMERPMEIYRRLSEQNGFLYRQDGEGVTVAGRLEAGAYAVPGDVSSQFITGLLFALTKLPGQSTLSLTGEVESRSYLDLTLSALRAFGFSAGWLNEKTLAVTGGMPGHSLNGFVEGDYSNAAFFDALNGLGGAVQLENLQPDSLQGDRVYQSYFDALGRGCAALSVADCPDLGPVLMAVAAAKHGCRLLHTRRLKMKESDRGAAMAEELKKFQVPVCLSEDEITVTGGALHPPEADLEGHNDHRIVMALTVLCTETGGRIRGAQAVAKSMPDFFFRLRCLGVEVLEDENE